jgi:hypothetical protein
MRVSALAASRIGQPETGLPTGPTAGRLHWSSNSEQIPGESPGSIPNFSRIELKTTYCYCVIVFGSAFCFGAVSADCAFFFPRTPCQIIDCYSQFPKHSHCEFRKLTLYSTPVNRLTKQEQLVICIIAGLLLLGWAVKTYRTAHPPAQTAEKSKA